MESSGQQIIKRLKKFIKKCKEEGRDHIPRLLCVQVIIPDKTHGRPMSRKEMGKTYQCISCSEHKFQYDFMVHWHTGELIAISGYCKNCQKPNIKAKDQYFEDLGTPDNRLVFLERMDNISGQISDWPQLVPACKWAASKIKELI